MESWTLEITETAFNDTDDGFESLTFIVIELQNKGWKLSTKHCPLDTPGKPHLHYHLQLFRERNKIIKN